jgi:anti-anti-sigma factor
METEIETRNNLAIYRIREDIQPLADYRTIHQGLTKLINDGHQNIAVDLSQVKYMYSDVATAFISAHNRVSTLGQGRFSVFGMNDAVKECLETLGLEEFIKIYPNEAALVKDQGSN